MTDRLLSSKNLRSLASPSTRIKGLADVLTRLGWPELRRVSATRPDLVELVAGGEPRVLFSSKEAAGGIARLAYSREAPYAVAISEDTIRLYASQRWDHWVGDSPIACASLGAVDDSRELFELLSRERIVIDAPSDLVGAGTEHPALYAVLGKALRSLRSQVAESDVYSSRTSRDTAVLRLFHQLLYVRVIEDRDSSPAPRAIRDVIEASNPSADLDDLLQHYERELDSELFAPAGISVADLPGSPLKEILLATVEPWERLALDFSVSRTELASRLYESYLSELPVRRHAAQAGHLFDIAETIDAREQQATFYTPPALATVLADDALARIIAAGAKPVDEVRVLDPACGSGAFLVAAYRRLREAVEHERGRVMRPKEREALLTNCIFGSDIDERALGIARVQLLEEAELNGQRLPRLADNLILGDALASPPDTEPSPNAVPWKDILDQHGAFDCVLTNPPFGAQAKLPERLSIATIRELGHRYPNVSTFGADYAYMFLSLARKLTGPDATAGFVMPRTILNQRAGVGARRVLSDWGIAALFDLRGAKVFRGVGAAICTIVADPRARVTNVSGLRDSRVSPVEALDALDNPAWKGPRTKRRRSALADAVKDGWTPFRLRWSELVAETDIALPKLADQADHIVRTGIKPARVADFVIPQEAWEENRAAIDTDGVAIPSRYLPQVVRSGDLKPFRLTLSGDRLFLPFDPTGKPSHQRSVLRLLRKKGGIPRNYQHGDLHVLLGPKILISGVAREPATTADPKGEYVPMMRGVHAVALRDQKPNDLPAIATLLHGAFYQWLLRGLGAPRADESVEVTVGAIGQLPWPTLGATEIGHLSRLGREVAQTLTAATDIDAIYSYHAARARLDEYVFDLVGATEALREIVTHELVRIA